MSFDSLQAFLNMGGHALYVWLSYGLAVLVIVFNLVRPLRGHRRFVRELAQRHRRERAAGDAGGTGPGGTGPGEGSARERGARGDGVQDHGAGMAGTR